MTSFYQVDESGGTSAVTLGEASEGSAIQDQYHEDVLTSNLDFDTIVEAGIYRYESIGDSSQHVPSDASSGYVFVFVESDKHSMRSIVQIAFDDNGGVLVRRGAISDTGTTIGAWEDLNASGSSTFAISSTSPAGTVGGSWSVVSGYEDVGIWKQVNIIMTLSDAVNTTILLDVATFALSGTQTIYVSNGDGTFSPIILDIINGGTGANSAAGARTALGAASQADLDSLRDSVNSIIVKTLRNSLNSNLYLASEALCPEGETLLPNSYYSFFRFTETYLGVLETMADGFVTFTYPTLYAVNSDILRVYFTIDEPIAAQDRLRLGIYVSYLTITR